MTASREDGTGGDLSRATPSPAVLDDAEVASLRDRLNSAVSRACPAWFEGHEEDIVQNALVQLLRSALKRGDRKSDLSSIYLSKVAHGAAVDEIRRWCRQREVPNRDEAMIERTPSANPSPEGETAAREIGRAIQQCLALMVRPRQLAVMLYLQGCSVPESARRLHWTVTKTENLVYRGLRDLRRCLTSKGLTA